MKEYDMYTLGSVILLVIGGLNWGLVGLFNVNLISAIFGIVLGRLIFIIVGVAAGYLCYLFYKEKMKKDAKIV